MSIASSLPIQANISSSAYTENRHFKINVHHTHMQIFCFYIGLSDMENQDSRYFFKYLSKIEIQNIFSYAFMVPNILSLVLTEGGVSFSYVCVNLRSKGMYNSLP